MGAPDTIVAEPLVPYPGGLPPLSSEAAGEDRRDVLCFTSAPLAEPLCLAGSPVVDLTTLCDRDTHDVVASLVLVDPGGEPRALSSGVRRVHAAPGEVTQHRLTMRPVAWACPPGSRLRLDVSGSRFPTFDRNPHVRTLPVAETPREEHRVATIEVRGGKLGLPVEVGS
jgi:putative CocE/NonD family hydrolase